MIANVLYEADVHGPPDDAATLINPRGWVHFWTADADAWIWPHGGSFLLHWIESRRKGDGSRLLAAISQWADERHINGSLTCEPELMPFYERQGWVYAGDYTTQFASTKLMRRDWRRP